MEAKHHRLARSQRAGQLDKDLKPNAETRNRLMEIVSYPATQPLVSEEQDLIWRFRYYLSSNKKALAKFVKCINWESSQEAVQALDLIHKWTPMDVEEAATVEYLRSMKLIRRTAPGRQRLQPVHNNGFRVK